MKELKIFVCVIFVVAAILLFVAFGMSPNQSAGTTDNAPRKFEQSRKSKDVQPISNQPKTKTCTTLPIVSSTGKRPLKTFSSVQQDVSAKVFEMYKNNKVPSETELDADPVLALAVFDLVVNCKSNEKIALALPLNSRPMPCPSIPDRYRDDPLGVLEKAALSGNAYAQLSFAINAHNFAQHVKGGRAQEDKSEAAEIMSKAEAFGSNAATSGMPEALDFMASAYQNSTFGRRDLKLAYVFLSSNKSVEDRQNEAARKRYLLSLKSQLSKDELISANEMIFGCNRDVDPATIISPF